MNECKGSSITISKELAGSPIYEIDFWKEAKYGDLLLFYSSLPMIGLNGSINWAGFHHVAMVADRDQHHV